VLNTLPRVSKTLPSVFTTLADVISVSKTLSSVLKTLPSVSTTLPNNTMNPLAGVVQGIVTLAPVPESVTGTVRLYIQMDDGSAGVLLSSLQYPRV